MYSIIKRRIFFWVLTLSFFAISPIILGYALGYRYSFDRGIFVYAGSITVKSNPPRALVDINGEPAPGSAFNYLNNSYHIDGLRPGTYELAVHQDGFKPWSKSVTVSSGLSTEFWNILLVRDHYDETHYSETRNIRRFFPAPRENLFAVASSPDTSGDAYALNVGIFDPDRDTMDPILSANDMRLHPDTEKNIEWSPEEDTLLVPVGRKKIPSKQGDIAFVSIPKSRFLFYLSEIFPEGFKNGEQEITSVRWSPREKKTFYFLYGRTLMRGSIEDPKNPEFQKVTDHAAGYDFFERTITYLDDRDQLLYTRPLGKDAQPKPLTNIAIPVEPDTTRVIAYDEKRIAVITPSGDLYIFNNGEYKTYIKQIGSSVAPSGVQFSNDGKKLLFWTDHEIFTYFLRDWDTQPQRSEDDLWGIARFFEPIKNVRWTDDYEHILFTLGNTIKLTELDSRGHRSLNDVYELNSPTPEMLLSGQNESLFFIDTVDGEPRLGSIRFPEPIPFLGF